MNIAANLLMQLKKSKVAAAEFATADAEPVEEKDDFPYNIVFGVWTSWMMTLSFLLFYKYFISAASGTAFKSPNIYWALSAWTLTPAWMATWGVWLYNIIMDNKGGPIHKFFSMVSIAYIAIPIILQPVILIINLFAARDSADFWTYWGLLFASDIANLVLIKFTLMGIQLEYIDAESKAMAANAKKCYDDAGVEVDCLKQVMAQIEAEQKKQEEERKEAIDACTTDCEAVIAANQPPPKWFTYEMYRTTARYFNENQDTLMYNLDIATKLEIYALGKQGRFGDNTDPEPFLLNIKEHLKWKAWNGKKGMDMLDAQEKFMNLMKTLGFYDMVPPNQCAIYTICLADNKTPNPDYVTPAPKMML